MGTAFSLIQNLRSRWYWTGDIIAYRRDVERYPWMFGQKDYVIYVDGRLRAINMSLKSALSKLTEEEKYRAYIIQHEEGEEIGHGQASPNARLSIQIPKDYPRLEKETNETGVFYHDEFL